MATESPFKFLDSYTIEDRDIFFGRDQEIEEVYKKVFQGQTLFIYGESGTGKSSLISCGLANRFKKSDWLPVNVRRGENINQSLLKELEKTSITKVSDLNGSFTKNLFKYTRSLYLDFFKPVYFIFDQFEELYLMGSKEEWREFIAGVKALTEHDLNVHFIFIIRSEYLHFLSEFEEELPEVFNNKIRVEKITRVKAKECIEGPCKLFDIKLEDSFADHLLDQLSPEGIEVELTYLQVYLDRIYKLAMSSHEGEDLEFSNELLDDIGLVGDVLADFLDEQIASFEDQQSAITVLKGFVTVEGTKKQASLEDVISFSRSLGHPIEEEVAEAVISQLLEKRILKILPDELRFELRHDALANKIFEKITLRERELIEVRQFLDLGLSEFKKRKFLLNERDLAYIQPHLPVLDLSGELKDFVNESTRAAGKKRRVRNRVIAIIIIIVILLITSLYAFFVAREQQELALEQKKMAEQSATAADAQKQIAEQNAASALMAQQQADANAEEALRQSDIADQQRLIAELQRNAADSSRIEAENQRLLALVQKDSAEAARAQALTYLELANTERANAEKLSMQSLARSLAIKSSQLPDPEQKALLAMQANLFNQAYQGYAYQSDIHNSLYLAQKANTSTEFNVIPQGHTAAVRAIVRSNGTLYSTGSDGRILRWTNEGGRLKSTTLAESDQIINTLDISPDGSKLAAGSSNSTVTIYSTGNGTIIKQFSAHPGEVWKVLFTSDNQLLSSGGDQTIKQWNLTSSGGTVLMKGATNIHAFAGLPDWQVIAGLENGNVISIREGSDPVALFTREADPVTVITLSNDMKRLAIGFESGSVQLWDVDNRVLDQTLPGHTAHVADLKFSKDDQFLISGGYDRKNLLWNLRSIKEQPVAWNDHESFVLAVAFTPDGRRVITGELNNTMKFFERNMSRYANRMCGYVRRNLTQREWTSFIGDKFNYQKTCKNLTQ